MFKKSNKQNKVTPIYGIIDERTRAIVYKGDAYAGRFMLFAVLIDGFIRGLHLSSPLIKSNGDLLLIVIIGGLISTAYQIKNKVVSHHSFVRSFIFIALFTAFIAFLVTSLFLK
ncbi:hypothetical protein [Clostridium ljungdahlii]|uniref:Uncharacterized protein n=1 Tax=Clostridium ljungdahlii TaxID=1538 RepID=A0A162L5N7_9CLOT|nr:hypothetical protein [Clostridium ljungdahlii]OAA84748.1 hypothetical protein WY13_02647 [Clostridium ljungdahlii]